MTTQATKRPWKVVINTHSHYLGSYQIWDKNGNSLTESDLEDEKIRGYVEKAVNYHDELVELLQEVRASKYKIDGLSAISTFWDRLEQALQKAEEI